MTKESLTQGVDPNRFPLTYAYLYGLGTKMLSCGAAARARMYVFPSLRYPAPVEIWRQLDSRDGR